MPVRTGASKEAAYRSSWLDEVAGGQEGVRGGAAVGQPGSRFSQFGREQAERVPACGAPALADSAAVEDDVLAAGQR